jgi:hypothetical protein
MIFLRYFLFLMKMYNKYEQQEYKNFTPTFKIVPVNSVADPDPVHFYLKDPRSGYVIRIRDPG